jgi:Na+/H+ antiporter NhaD/arsenite permease-like protein
MYYTALVIFLITYTGIIFTRLPKMNIDRPSAAIFGAVAMVLFGVLSFDEAIRAIDFNTIALLLGMMIIISTLELDGFFSLIASKTLSYSKSPFRLLVILTFVTGIASAFLVNDAVVLLFTPVIILICRTAKLNPLPFLVAEILASNVGSAMTITGNPQNMLIGINSGISYGDFMLSLMPVSLLGMIIIILVVKWVYAADFRNKKPIDGEISVPGTSHSSEFSFNYKSMRTSVPIFGIVVLLFFISRPLGLSIPMIALLGGSLILIFGKIKPSKVIQKVDWVLLLFFASLFIVVHGIEKAGLMDRMVNSFSLQENIAGLGGIHAISFVLSQVVSNVPFTVVMLPLMKSAHSETLWLALASASTLAGNATIIGAMANLIVIESAGNNGIKIRFREFMKSGILVTILTMALSFGILWLRLG